MKENINTQIDVGLKDYMLRVYSYMASGLGLTALTAFVVINTGLFKHLINWETGGYNMFGYVLLFSPLILVIFMSAKIMSLSSSSARGLFFLYAALVGASLSVFLLMFQIETIFRAFGITAATFLGMSLYGYTTKRDLTRIGAFAIMGVIGIIIASLINIFFQSSALMFAIDILAVFIFTILTAFDVQKIKRIYYQVGSESELSHKLAVFGALSLYIDFINIFIHLLSIMGRRR